MKVKNLTDKTQILVLKPLVGEDREYEIYLQSKGSTEIDSHLVITNKGELNGKVEFEGESVEVKEVAPVEVPKIPEVEPVVEEAPVEEAPAPDKFVCEICGAEFASARGLNTHMNKAHANK